MSSGLLDMQGVGGSSPLVLTSLNVPEAFIYKGFGDFFAFYSAAVWQGKISLLWTGCGQNKISLPVFLRCFVSPAPN